MNLINILQYIIILLIIHWETMNVYYVSGTDIEKFLALWDLKWNYYIQIIALPKYQ